MVVQDEISFTKVKNGEDGVKGDPTGLTEQNEIPVNPYEGMLWKNTGNNAGYISGATYRWNGSVWELYVFAAANIVAETLSAIVSNLGTVNAGKIVNTGTYKDDRANINYTTTLAGMINMAWTLVNSTQNGTFDISPTGLKSVSFIDSAKTKPAWEWTAGAEGFRSSSGATATKNLLSSYLSPEGIYMEDSNYSKYGLGRVNLNYQDLMTVPETLLEPVSGFHRYSDTSVNRPVAKRTIGKIIRLSGAFTNDESFDSSYTDLPMGKVPDWATPESNVNFVVQGSSMNRFLLTITTEGKIMIGRYGTSDYSTVAKGSWLNIACLYTAKEL